MTVVATPPIASSEAGSLDAGYAAIDRLRADPSGRDALVALLAEQSPLFAGRSSNQAARLRGYLLAAFETCGLPDAAMSIVCEELESGIDPFVVAAAARAVRCASTTPAELPALLLAAIRRLRGADDVVTLAPADAAAPVTVLTELFRTLRWLGPRAAGVAAPFAELLSHDQAMLSDTVRREGRLALGAIRSAAESAPPSCCGAPAPLVLPRDNRVPADADIDVAAIALQDQDGSVASFGEIFRGRPSVLTFFYTRCANPNKCSLTIQKLAQLQTLIAEAGLPEVVNVAAISYDGAFDLPHRLRTYGEARGMRFDRFNRMLRTIGDFEPVRRWLDLGVGYGATTVNHHRLDLVVLDRSMRCVERIARRQWNEHELFDIIRRVLRNDGNVQT